MVREQNSRDNLQYQRSRISQRSGDPYAQGNQSVPTKKHKSAGKFSHIKQKTKALLSKYYCCPLSAIRDVTEFREDDILVDPKNKDYVQAAFDDFGKDLNDMTLRDFYNLLKDKDPLFLTSMNYGSIEDSTNWIVDLLKFQFDDNEEHICEFLTAIVDIVDKRLPKTNALSVYSPPSAGKNFFFDMIFAICVNYGQLGAANRHNVFAFQEAPNKRILIWNEPNYETSLTDTIKMMLGGDPYTVRVKHCMDTHVKRTPVIILTNNHVPFLGDKAFRDRIVKFTWRAASFLKDIDEKPYPMCFFNVLNKYNIEF